MPEDIRDGVSKYITEKVIRSNLTNFTLTNVKLTDMHFFVLIQVECQELFSAQTASSLSRQTSEDSSRVFTSKSGMLAPSLSSFSSEISPDSPPVAHGAPATTSNRFFSGTEPGEREKVLLDLLLKTH